MAKKKVTKSIDKSLKYWIIGIVIAVIILGLALNYSSKSSKGRQEGGLGGFLSNLLGEPDDEVEDPDIDDDERDTCNKDADCGPGFECEEDILGFRGCFKIVADECIVTSECNGKFCDNGKCVECRVHSDCTGIEFCDEEGECVDLVDECEFVVPVGTACRGITMVNCGIGECFRLRM